MARSRAQKMAALMLIATLFLEIPIASAAGRSTSATVNTILNGRGTPKSSLGVNGDFYIDTRSLLLYGPKSKGRWPSPFNIQGPTGAPGSDGKNGSDARAATNASVSAVTGAKGEQGPKGERGEPGLPGVTGATGPAGPAGALGPAGAPGVSGLNGASGAAGATGASGATGAQGAAGASGAKGETGTTGPSEITVIEIPTFTLQSSIGFTYIASELFGVLRANNSYRFDIYLNAPSGDSGAVLGIDVVASGGAINFNYLRTDYRKATYTTALASYGFLITGTLAVGATDSAIALRVIDAYGLTGANPLAFTGKAYITLVGAIR